MILISFRTTSTVLNKFCRHSCLTRPTRLSHVSWFIPSLLPRFCFDGQHYFPIFWSRTRCLFYESTSISSRSPHTHNTTNNHHANSPKTHHKLIDITLCTTSATSCHFDPFSICQVLFHAQFERGLALSLLMDCGSPAPWMSWQKCCVDVSIMDATPKKLPCIVCEHHFALLQFHMINEQLMRCGSSKGRIRRRGT